MSDFLPNLRDWQTEFIDRYLADQKASSILIARPGTGKTLTALVTAARMLDNNHAEAVVVISDRTLLKEQWVQTGRSLNLDFDSAEEGYKKNKAYSLVIQGLKEKTKDKLLEAAAEINFFVLVDDLHRIPSVYYLIEDLLKVNKNTKILCLTSRTEAAEPGFFEKVYGFRSEYIFEDAIIEAPETKIIIATLSPSFGILEKILKQKLNTQDLHWREFEKMIAQLLENDGYEIELTRGSKDGGVDVFAYKDIGIAGRFKTVWQAKKNSLKNKVGLSIIRELADTTSEEKASKGIIVTTTYLTKDALQRVQRDQHILGKVDKDDLENWIRKTLEGR